MILVPPEIAWFMPHRVEHLANAPGPVPVLFHELRQRWRTRSRLTNIDLVIQHAGRLGIQPAEKRRTGRPTNRVLAVGPGEDQALLGQAIEVGCLDVLIPGSADMRIQIIANNEQHIQLCIGQVGGEQKAEKRRGFVQEIHLVLFCF